MDEVRVSMTQSLAEAPPPPSLPPAPGYPVPGWGSPPRPTFAARVRTLWQNYRAGTPNAVPSFALRAVSFVFFIVAIFVWPAVLLFAILFWLGQWLGTRRPAPYGHWYAGMQGGSLRPYFWIGTILFLGGLPLMASGGILTGVIVLIVGIVLVWVKAKPAAVSGPMSGATPQSPPSYPPQAPPPTVSFPPPAQQPPPALQPTSPPPPGVIAPAAASAPAPFCSSCGAPTTYLPQYGRFFCFPCYRYV